MTEPDKEKALVAPLSVTTFAPEKREIGAAPAAPKKKPKIALFVAHGMGQQIPFETMDSVAQGLGKAATRAGRPVAEMRATTVRLSGFKTQRIEMDMHDANGREVEVHVYEGYWAPFTEGEVTIRDVMSFLVRGGINGIRNAYTSFYRRIFNRNVDFGIRRRTASYLLIALGVVLSLITFNALIAIVAADRFTNGGVHDGATDVFGADFSAVTTLVGALVVAAFAVALCLGAVMITKWRASGRPGKLWEAGATLTAGLIYSWMGAMIFGTFVVLPLLAAGIVPAESFTCALFANNWPWVWGGLLLVSYGVRTVLIQYMGDVAAYVSTHTLDRFNDMRSKIKAAVLSSLRAIYEMPEYGQVSIVGHSLGSVVVYDALNTMLTDDTLAGGGLDAVGRTRLLVTFGSPLDKTAFIFATQWAKTTEIREALAASFQPLIDRYEPFRDIRWINIYADRDVISGALDFYDDLNNPQSTTRRVRNVPDPDANIPFIAHVEYWRNPLLFDLLYENM
jgi:hypothetical protein